MASETRITQKSTRSECEQELMKVDDRRWKLKVDEIVESVTVDDIYVKLITVDNIYLRKFARFHDSLLEYKSLFSFFPHSQFFVFRTHCYFLHVASHHLNI